MEPLTRYTLLEGAYLERSALRLQLDSRHAVTELGRAAYEAGCTLDEVRGCIRHLIV